MTILDTAAAPLKIWASQYAENEKRFEAEKAKHELAQIRVKGVASAFLFDQIKGLHFKTNSPEGSQHYLAGCILRPVDVVVDLPTMGIWVVLRIVGAGPNSSQIDFGRLVQEIPENLIEV